MKTLTIKQPWAWAIITQGKDIENRTWSTKYRGRFYVHAGKSIDHNAPEDLGNAFNRAVASGDPLTQTGGLIGMVTLTDVIKAPEGNHYHWFQGPFGFVLKDPVPVDFFPCAGQLRFFEMEICNSNFPRP